MTAKQTGISFNLSLSLIDSKEATKADKGRGEPHITCSTHALSVRHFIDQRMDRSFLELTTFNPLPTAPCFSPPLTS